VQRCPGQCCDCRRACTHICYVLFHLFFEAKWQRFAIHHSLACEISSARNSNKLISMRDDAIHAVGGATVTIQSMQEQLLNFKMEDGFEVVRKLGQGGFGTVWLCKRTTGAPRVRFRTFINLLCPTPMHRYITCFFAFFCVRSWML
jgi:hypothetical protein